MTVHFLSCKKRLIGIDRWNNIKSSDYDVGDRLLKTFWIDLEKILLFLLIFFFFAFKTFPIKAIINIVNTCFCFYIEHCKIVNQSIKYFCSIQPYKCWFIIFIVFPNQIDILSIIFKRILI